MSRACILCGQNRSELLFVKRGFELVRCLVCELVFVGNPPPPREQRELYSFSRGYHEELSAEVAGFEAEIRAARHDLALLHRYRRQGRLLDVGCSVGFFLRVARESGWETRGLEVSDDTAEIARRRYGLDVVSGTLETASFPARFFDVVTMWDVLEHIEDPRQALERVRELLKESGLLVVETPNIDGLFPRLSYPFARVLGQWRHPEPPAHLFQFSKGTLSKLLGSSGFQILEIRDERIPLRYSFGRRKRLFHSLRRLVHAALFAPLALTGPWVRQGDTVIVFARKT